MIHEKPRLLPGLLLGLGFGGFVDGIVLHEILQWHHMISGAESSNTLAGLKLNVVADGFFHVVTWLLVMAGSIMTRVSWRKGRLAPTCSFHFGLLFAGWGIFNSPICSSGPNYGCCQPITAYVLLKVAHQIIVGSTLRPASKGALHGHR